MQHHLISSRAELGAPALALGLALVLGCGDSVVVFGQQDPDATGGHGGAGGATSSGGEGDGAGASIGGTGGAAGGMSEAGGGMGGVPDPLGCVDEDIGTTTGADLVVTDFLGATDDVPLSCWYPSVDHIVQFEAPEDGVYTIGDPDDYAVEITYGVLDGDCSGLQLGCVEANAGPQSEGWPPGAEVVLALAQGQTVLIVMSRLVSSSASTSLDISHVATGSDTSCVDFDLGSAVGLAVASGDLTDTEGHVYAFEAPQTSTYVLSTLNSGASEMTINAAGCAGNTDLAPLDDFTLGPAQQMLGPGALRSVDLVQGQRVTIHIGGAGAYDLDITMNATAGGTCCSPHHGGGCDVPAVQACVCATDGYCCTNPFDVFCRNNARQLCDANCI